LAICDFFLFPKPKGRPFDSGGDPAGIAECSWHASRTGLPAGVPAMAMGTILKGALPSPNLNQVNTF